MHTTHPTKGIPLLPETSSRLTGHDHTTDAVVTATGLRRTYGAGEAAVHALAGVDVALRRGELTAIMGPSGSGKSTLMHCLAGLDAPDGGEVVLDGTRLTGLDEDGLTALRRDRIGFVFQAFNLIPTLTARENIELPLRIAGKATDAAFFDEIVDVVGLASRLDHRPHEMSGGQQQRVACARALLSRPSIVFADEPTGNLDSVASADVLGFLRDSSDRFDQSIAMVTHDPGAASYAHRILFLADGRLVGELVEPTADAVVDVLRDIVGGGRR